MSKIIKVNWEELNRLSSRTSANAEEFEQIRQRMIQIMSSLQSCWQGGDSTKFINKAITYLEKIKVDSQYLMELGDFYNKSSRKYNGGVEEGLTKVRQVRNEIEQEQKIPPTHMEV